MAAEGRVDDNDEGEGGKAAAQEGGRNNASSEMTARGAAAAGGALRLPLRPPFRLIQAGPHRTGSTFQHKLLLAIATRMSPNATRIEDTMSFDEDYVKRKVRADESFVSKTHKVLPFFEELQSRGQIAVFSSGGIVEYSLYNQDRANLEKCGPGCEVEAYRDIFGLSDGDVAVLKEHMTLYATLRQCCGHQMSKFEYYRLQGCNITSYTSRRDYPRCEERNVTGAEVRYFESPVHIRGERRSRKFDWAKPGDCERLNMALISGNGKYLGKRWPGCEHFAERFSG